MGNRLLMLTDDEAEFVGDLLALWVTMYAGDQDEVTDRKRVDRFHVHRKLMGKYTAAEIEEVGEVALGMMG